MNHKSCRSTSNSIDKKTAIVQYDFDNPIYQDDAEGEEECELLKELARFLRQESKVIQPCQEVVEIVNLGTK